MRESKSHLAAGYFHERKGGLGHEAETFADSFGMLAL